MAKDPFDDLRSQFEGSGLGLDELGTEADPDESAEYLVAEMSEGEFDRAAKIAEDQGIDEITTERSPYDTGILARFRKDK